MTILFLDTERDQHNRIIQIGVAVFSDDGELQDTFKSYINTGAKIPWQIEELTGIRNDFLQKQDFAEKVNMRLDIFLNKIKKKEEKLLTYVWGEDGVYVKKYYKELDITEIPMTIENIQKRVALKLTESKKKTLSLKSACDMLNIGFEQNHDALQDAINTANVYFKSQSETIQKYISLEILNKIETITIVKPPKELAGYVINCEGIAKKNKNNKKKEEELKQTKEELINELCVLEKQMNGKKEKKEKYKLIDHIDRKCDALLEIFKIESDIYRKNKKQIEEMKSTIMEIYEKKEKEMIEDTKENRKELRLLIWLKKNIEVFDSFRITGYEEKHWDVFQREFQKLEVKEKNHV